MAANNIIEGEHDRKGTKKVGALRGLMPYMLRYRALLAGSIVALIFTAMISLVLPMAVRRVVDGFQTGSTELLDKYFIAAIGIAAALAVGTGLRYYMVSRLGERVVADIRKAVFDRMVGMSPAFYEKLMTGEVLSRITTDTTLILSVVGSSMSWFLRNCLLFLGGLLMMLLTSAKLTGLVLLLVPLVIVPIIALGRRVRRLSRDNQDWIAKSSGKASETLLSVQAVQAFGHETLSRGQFADVTEKSFEAAKARISVRAVLTVIIIFLVFAGIVGVLWIGARDVRTDVMTIGELVQFVIYAGIMAGSTAALSEIWGEMQRAAGATERLVDLLNAEDTVQDPTPFQPAVHPGKGEIRFEDVVFHYPTRPDQAALNGVTLTVQPGETVALVGPSGAGKTTILQMLLRFYDPQSGTVRLDGIDLRDMMRDDFRQQIALVPQEPVIFADTAMENIRFGRPDASDEDVRDAARAAAADDFIEALPEGYNAQLGERGVMLSGGQKQRVAIARAILRQAPVLLLDEATSALDAESERAVQQAFEELSQDRTTLIVAHRLSTVKKADRILVFDEGRIVAEGNHETLVAQEGLYARLAKLQFTESLAAE